MGRARLCVLAVVLAGCIASPAPLLFVPAKDSTVQARAIAASWRDDATLVRIHGVEPSVAFTELPGLADDVDARRGDGRAQAWEYLFAADQQAYSVVIKANGEAVRHGPVERPLEDGFGNLGTRGLGWNLDSDEVVHIVRRNAPDWDSAAASAQIVHWYLVPLPQVEAAHWIVGFEARPQGRTYLVNAVNGSLSSVDLSVLQGAGVPIEVGGRHNVLLTPQQPTFQLPFEVEASQHPSLVIGLRVERTTTGSVNLTLRRDGAELRHVDWAANAPPGVQKREVLWPPNGTYELSARLTSLAPQSVDLFWCATGLPARTGSTSACRL